MNSHEKRHGGYRGSMQGRGRYGDGFDDGSGFMDETDREVSSLTDRAFRSLCIGEEAVYNDSSPVERHKAFADEAVGGSGREMLPRGVAEGTSGMAPLFQLPAADEAVDLAGGDCASHHSNGVVEAAWQQKRSSSKVSSLIRAYDGNGGVAAEAALMSQESMYTPRKDSWDGSALMSIQKELSEFSSMYHESIKGSSYTQTRNHFHSTEVSAAPQLLSSGPSPAFSKSSSKYSSSSKMPCARNFFLHSEFSPFQTWKEYNRLLYDREAAPQVLSTDQSPRWYDSPFYKELTVAHRAQMAQLEEQRSHRKQYDSAVLAEPPASAVCQKAPTVEKRSESEKAVNCPPWKRSQEPVKNKFPQNRPCTASPLSDKSRRKEDSLVSTGRLSATNYKAQTVADDQTSNSGTPFSISQLLTPTIHPRQETETSEILQYALSPNIHSPRPPSETDPRQTPEIKPRNKYKAMASSLLFNLKDNRKRVKSTYTPTMFKSTEIADHSKQSSQLDSLVTSDTPLSWTGAPVRSNGMELQPISNPVSQNTKTHTFNLARRADGCQSDDYLSLVSPKTVREASSYRSFSHTPQESGSFRDKLADAQTGRLVDSLFPTSKSNETPVGKRMDPSPWKEIGSSQGQNIKLKAPEMQGLPHSLNRKENFKEITEMDVPMSRANECVENVRAGGQLDYKLDAEPNLIQNTNKEKGAFRTERAPMMGDIAALLEKDRQRLEAQRGNGDKQGAIFSGEKYSIKNEFFANSIKNEFSANREQGNVTQELLAMKEKQCTQNELFRKNEVSEIRPSVRDEAKRQNLYATNEGLNMRQEHRHISQGLYAAQENYCDNLGANKGLNPTREMKYSSADAFGGIEQAKQALAVTGENRAVKNGFVVKDQDGNYLQGLVRQRIPSRTDDRNISNITSVPNQHEKSFQEISHHVAKDKHPSNEAFAFAEHNASKLVQAATEKKAIFASETANQVRHAPIEEFARKDRELEKQRLTAMANPKHEPVKVQALIKQYEGSVGENGNGANKGLFMTGEGKETKIGEVQEKYMSKTFSVTGPEQRNLLHAPQYSTAPSDPANDRRGFNAELPGAAEYAGSAKDVLVSRPSKPIENLAFLSKAPEHETVLPREKGQSRQEKLTSKLKAHAEKEIFAIKEKGHAKWDANATKQKELYPYGNKDGVSLPTERVKKNNGNHPAKQDSATMKEAHSRAGVFINQEASPSVDRVKSLKGDGENRLPNPASTTREKDHSRNFIQKISIRQEELQSIARAKIEAIAVNRIHQPKRANEESSYVPLASPLSLRKNAEHFRPEAIANISQAEMEDAKKYVHAVKEREQVKMEGLLEGKENTQNLGIADSGIHMAKNVLTNKEISSVSQVPFTSAELTTNESENQQVGKETFLKREREVDTIDVPANREVSAKHLISEPIKKEPMANPEKHEEAIPVTIDKEHASNYLFVSQERGSTKQEVPTSEEDFGIKNFIAYNETSLIREGIGTEETGQPKHEPAVLQIDNHAQLGFLASRKSEQAGNDALAIRSTQEELSPVTNIKIEAIMENQRQKSAHELANKNRPCVMNEPLPPLEKENSVSEANTISENTLTKPVADARSETEDDKNDALAGEERISPSQEVPMLAQHRNKSIAVQERDVDERVEKEHAKNGEQSKESEIFRQEGPSVEHIRIKIISHDDVPQVSESIISLQNAKHVTSALQENQQVKLDSVASRNNEHAEHDHRKTEGFGIKQEEPAPIVHAEFEVAAISESPRAKQEPENGDIDHTKREIPVSVEKEYMKEEMDPGKDNYLANPEIVASREVECAKNNEFTKKEKISVVEEEPPSVEHIRIKIISHEADQPDREKIVSIEKEKISLHENSQLKLDSLESGKRESVENNIVGFPERIQSRQKLSPVAFTEAGTTEEDPRHKAEHEPANKDRGTPSHELPQSMEKVNGKNETSALNENHPPEPEAVAPREEEGDESDERMEEVPTPVEHITPIATIEEEMHGNEWGIAVTEQKEHAESNETVSKEQTSFTQNEPSEEHNRIQIIPVPDAYQVGDNIVAIENEHSRHETAEYMKDSLSSRQNDYAVKNAQDNTQRTNDSLEQSPSQITNESMAIERNHLLENVLERIDGSHVVIQPPTSREKEPFEKGTMEINEKNIPEPDILIMRDTEDEKKDSVAKKETVNLGWELPLSLECVEMEKIQKNEDQPVKWEAHEPAQHVASKETDKHGTIVEIEKRSVGPGEFSSVTHVKSEVKTNHKPENELVSEVTDSIRHELPQQREDEPPQEGSIAVIEKQKGKQEVLPNRTVEFVEKVLAHNNMESVIQEHTQKETSFEKNDHITQDLSSGRKEHSGSFVYANKKETNVGDEEIPFIPLTEAIAISESHQAKHDLTKRGRENVMHGRTPAGGDNLGSINTTFAENSFPRQEVNMRQEEDAKNEEIVNKGRDGMRLKVLPVKKKEQVRTVRSVTDKIHQAVLADRNGNNDSESSPKIKHVADKSIAGSENHRDKREVLSTRERSHGQIQTIALEENLQSKLEALARRRKEKAEKYARANIDGKNTRQRDRASTPQAKTEHLIANKNRLAKHGLVIDDSGNITYAVPMSEKENIRNATTAASGKTEVGYSKRDMLVHNETASGRPRELVSRTREHHQNEKLVMGDHQVQHFLDNKQKGMINQAHLPSENIKNESISTSQNDRATREAFAMSKKHDAWHDSVTPREKANDKKQVIAKEKQSVRIETGAKDGEYAKGEVLAANRSIIKGEQSTTEIGHTILDYLLEKDRDRVVYSRYAVRDMDTSKQEVHEPKDSTIKEILELEKKELFKKEGFACRGNDTVSNIATKDRGQEADSILPEVLVRKYEVPAENTFSFRDEHQNKRVTDEAAKPIKEELFSRKYQSPSGNVKEHATHTMLETKYHPKREAIATSSSKQEMDQGKGREPIRKDIFAVKGKGETAGDTLSTKHTDYPKSIESVDRGRCTNRQEEQYQILSESTSINQDRNLSKSAAEAMKAKELSKHERIVSKGGVNQPVLVKNVDLYPTPEVISTHEKVNTYPDAYATTDKAKYHSGKKALSPERQRYSSKRPTLTSDESDDLHRRNVIPRENYKKEMEALANTQNEMKETLSLREKQRDILAMREHQRAIACQKQQRYEQEPLPKQEYAMHRTLPIKEKPDMRPEVPAKFVKENAQKEVLANNRQDGTEIAARYQPNQNIDGQNIHELHKQAVRSLQASNRSGAAISSQQPGHIKVPSRESYLTVGDALHSPEEESKPRPSSRSVQIQMGRGAEEKNVVEDVKKDTGKPGEALQYYAIINHERKVEDGDRSVALSLRHERTPREEASGLVHGETNEDDLGQSLTGHTMGQIPTPRSNTSSPSLGKPILFKVKDNSLRASPVTKAVKPCFHKMLDAQRLGSSQENLSVLESGGEECDHLKEHVDAPILHNARAASPRVSRSRDLPGQHILPAADFTTTSALQAQNIHSTPEYTTARAPQAQNIHSTPEFTSARVPQAQNIHSTPEYTTARAPQAHNIHSTPEYTTARAPQAHNIHSTPEYTTARAPQAHNIHSAPEYTTARAPQAHNIHSTPEYTTARAPQAQNIHSTPEYTTARAPQAHNIHSTPEYTTARAPQAHNIHSTPEYTTARAPQAHNIHSTPEYTTARAPQAHNIHSTPEYTTARAPQAHNIHSTPEYTTARAPQAHNIHSTVESTTAREQPAQNVVPPSEFISVREPRTYYRRNRRLEEDGRTSVISTMSEDLESCATSVTGIGDERSSAGMYAENPYSRPESACSDMRPFGKPPTVPPKSEKALLRAKKLTTRRIKKAEAKAKSQSPVPAEHKPLRAVASMPSSPTEPLVARRPASAQQALPQYCVDPGYAPHPAPSLVAQPFPLTQRKLLQDPNSGQYFVVDMPVPVKTKMFFDPETGKYVQLSVRQSPERTRSNTSSVELMSPPPYVVYPGFLPMPVSSLPPRRSASQMSAPAALMDEREKRSSDPRRQEAFRRKHSREAEPYIEPSYRSHDQMGETPSYDDERGDTNSRNLNIIPMGELEDFAMESS